MTLSLRLRSSSGTIDESGGLTEWPKVTVLKTVVSAMAPGVRIPRPPPDRLRCGVGLTISTLGVHALGLSVLETCLSGRKGLPAKELIVLRDSGVRIPSSPLSVPGRCSAMSRDFIVYGALRSHM